MHEGDARVESLAFLLIAQESGNWKWRDTCLRQVPENRGLQNIWQKSVHLSGEATARQERCESRQAKQRWPNASFYGHEVVVKLLLARNDVDLNKQDNHG